MKNRNINNIYKSGLSLKDMKKENEKLLIFVVFSLIFGIFLISGVSADVNFALDGTASVTDTGSWPYGTSWTMNNPERINDNNLGTYQGVLSSGKNIFRNWMETYLHYEVVVDLGSPQIINKIKYLRTNVVPGSIVSHEKTYVYSGGQWNLINNRGFLSGTGTETITGTWNDVESIKVEFYLATGWFTKDSYASSYIYELEVWGPDPFVCGDGSCNGNEDCSSCPQDCGACPSINTCSSSDDVIMKLSTSNNSLGALWDYASYTYGICCEDIFGIGNSACDMSLIPNPHLCNSNNKVLGLSATSDAFGEIPEGSIYTTNEVCYGDLECISNLNSAECNTWGGKVVVSLNSLSSSLISAGDFAVSGIPISTCDELQGIGTTSGALDDDYYLTQDIDCSATNPSNTDNSGSIWDNYGRGFNPIGIFRGTFDGQGHVISDLFIDRFASEGLFESTRPGSEIKNIGLINVNITGNDNTGSLVGLNMGGNINNCYVTGTVDGGNDRDIGGLVGDNDDWYGDGVINNSYSTASVNGGDNVGGLVGDNDAIIINSYSTGSVTGGSSVGGLVGSNFGGTCTDSFWDTQTSGQASSDGCGTGKTTAEMQQQSTFTNWDFISIWDIDGVTNNGYAFLIGSADYSVKICCRQEVIPAGNIYWADMNGNPIVNAEIGDSVLMIVKNTGLNQGDSIVFEIFENDLIFNDNIRTGSEAITILVDINGDVKAKWTILQSDLDKTSDLDNFIFKANSLTSNELLINTIETNSPPQTQIINPVAETNYIIRQGQINTNIISFEQISSDIDDDLSLSWKFGDGEGASFDNCLSGTNCNTTHKYTIYTIAGTKNIILSAQEMGRNSIPVKDNSRIYIYKEGLVAYVVMDQIVTGRLVEIDATQTKVSDCDYVQATCEGKYGVGSCYEVVDTIDLLESVWCYDKTLRVNGIDSNPNLFLDWTVDGVAFTPTQNGNEMKYIKIFDEPGDHIINLEVGYKL